MQIIWSSVVILGMIKEHILGMKLQFTFLNDVMDLSPLVTELCKKTKSCVLELNGFGLVLMF